MLIFYYCKETGRELLPTFYYILANAFLKKDNYKKILNELCDKQGFEEDGIIKDEYTGYPIKDRDFDESEGYDELGFKVVTNDIIVDENEDYENETMNQEIEYLLTNIINNDDDEEEEKINETSNEKTINFINRTVEILEKYLRINISSLKQFIVQKVISLFEKYGKTSKDGKEEVSLFTIFLMTISMFLISLQLLHPKVKLNKNIPGCTVSLVGYPVYNIDDDSSIEFMACLVKRQEKYMNYDIKKMKISDIKDNIKKILEKIIVPELKYIIEKKRKSVKEQNKEISTAIDKSDFGTFHPPLKDFKLKAQMNISDSIISNIKDNDIELNDTLLVIKSKNMLLSYDVINSINTIIKQENPLLKNIYEEPYLENACCVDSDIKNSFNYFENKNKHIENVSKYISGNNKLILKIEKYKKAHTLQININTSFKYPVISDTLEQPVIDLLIRKNDNIETISELSSYYKNNLINYTISDNVVNKIELFRSELDAIQPDVYNIENFSLVDLKKKLFDLMDVFDIMLQKNSDTKEIKKDIIEIRKYVSDNLDKIKDNLVKDLGLKRSSQEKNELFTYIDKFIVYNSDNHNIHQYMNYMINTIEEVGTIFPLMIINNISFNDKKIPGHWNIGKLHTIQIKKYIENYYIKLSTFLGNEQIKNILTKVTNQSKYILSFLRKLPYFNTDSMRKNETIFNKKMIEEIFYFMFIYILSIYVYEVKKLDVKGDKKIIKDLLLSYLEILNLSYNKIYINKQEILKKVLRDKEKEKDKITRKYKYELTKEEKEISVFFKTHKLGEWGVGLQKSFVKYDKNMDEKNRNETQDDIENNYIGHINEDNDQEIIGY